MSIKAFKSDKKQLAFCSCLAYFSQLFVCRLMRRYVFLGNMAKLFLCLLLFRRTKIAF